MIHVNRFVKTVFVLTCLTFSASPAIAAPRENYYTESLGESSYNSNTNYQDKATLTFTPATAGDYLIIASASVDSSSTSRDWRAQLDIDGSTYNTANVEPVNSAIRNSWGSFRKVNLSNASHTVKLQYSIESGGTAGITYAHLIALRLDQFGANYYAETNAYTTYTSTSYQSYASLTQTPSAADHLILGYAGGSSGSTSYSGFWQLEKGGSSYAEMLVEPLDTTTRGFPYLSSRKESLSASSTTWNMQARIENASTFVSIQDSQIAVIELTEPGAAVSISLATDGAVAYGTQTVSATTDTTSNGVNDTETVQNNGNVAEDFDISGAASAAWTLAATAGADQYAHKFCITTCDSSPTWTALTGSNQALATSVAASGTQAFDLQLLMPTSTASYAEQTLNVTVTASAS